MFSKLLEKTFGSQSERTFKKSHLTIEEINRLAADYTGLDEQQLLDKTAEFKSLLQQRTGADAEQLRQLEETLRGDMELDERERLNDQYDTLDQNIRQTEDTVLDEIMPQAFALVKETCRRLLGRQWDRAGEPVEWDMVPFDVQLFGAQVLHQGKVAEMATGEGKTLVATMPLYLNALTERGVHLITHNGYLAKRDAMWMGPVFNHLGLSVGIIQDAHQVGGIEAFILSRPEGVPEQPEWRQTTWKEAYTADIVYATKDQIGFHYLYDNMAPRRQDIMHREFNYAIVDEADSNLIDDARTPLIISGRVAESTNRYAELKPMVDKLIRAQTTLVNKLIANVEKRLEQGDQDDYEIGVDLLKASRGTPKNRRLMKVLQEEGVKRQINRVEADYMRDKRMSDIDEALYYMTDEKSHSVDFTDKGRDLLSPDEQALFILPDLSEEVDAIRRDESLDAEEKTRKEEEAHRDYAEQSEAVHNIHQLMKAYSLFEKDVQYMVDEGGRIVIVDESTGRPQPGRRFADGMHQALEAKEGVKIQDETQTIASITLQNLFRMYRKLAGMTGTAETEAGELWEIYKLDVVVIPTNRPIRRVDLEDQIFCTKREKFNALIDDVERLNKMGLPILVGTISVETSELLSRMLTRKGIKHQLLNARYHEKEAQIVAAAGQPGAVTIATNMAGRGTDIKLPSEVVGLERDLLDSPITLDDRLPSGETLFQHLVDAPHGLQVIGTERHDSRRIDRQLRGRSGRQGDPGNSRFYLSLEDDLMRLFGSERIASVMDKLGAEEGEVIEHSMVTRSIERAQKKVEARNFEMRKHLLEYDDVMNQQRQVIYNRRRDMLERDSVSDHVQEMIEDSIDAILTAYASADVHPSEWDWEGMEGEFGSTFFMGLTTDPEERADFGIIALRQHLLDIVQQSYQRRLEIVGAETFKEVEKAILLHTVDSSWQEHLYEMDELRDGVSFVGYGGKTPLVEYKKGAYDMFEELIKRIAKESLRNLFQLRIEAEAPTLPPPRSTGGGRHDLIHREATNMGFGGMQPPVEGAAATSPQRDKGFTTSGGGVEEAPEVRQPIRTGPKVGRNDPCPCGSGKKYKRCHGLTE
jgi:preprotein translocase subunit SecA